MEVLYLGNLDRLDVLSTTNLDFSKVMKLFLFNLLLVCPLLPLLHFLLFYLLLVCPLLPLLHFLRRLHLLLFLMRLLLVHWLQLNLQLFLLQPLRQHWLHQLLFLLQLHQLLLLLQLLLLHLISIKWTVMQSINPKYIVLAASKTGIHLLYTNLQWCTMVMKINQGNDTVGVTY